MRRAGPCRGSAPRSRLRTLLGRAPGGVRAAGRTDTQASRPRPLARSHLLEGLTNHRRHGGASLRRDQAKALQQRLGYRDSGATHSIMIALMMTALKSLRPLPRPRGNLDCVASPWNRAGRPPRVCPLSNRSSCRPPEE
jgi:hypothetical protein